MRPYSDFPDFKQLYLEDSYVKQISLDPKRISLIIEAVILKDHPLFSEPRCGEKYCYRDVRLSFHSVKTCEWKNFSWPLHVPDDGMEQDFGNMDWLYYDEGLFYFGGDFGEIIVSCDLPILEFI